MNARQQRIVERLRHAREVSVRDLAKALQAAPVTIRRDLARLARAGALVRTHGGAMRAQVGVAAFAFRERAERRAAQKAAIARAVAGALRPDMTLALDTGTTTLAAARALAGIPRLRVLTNSLAIASALHACDSMDLVLLGGQARRHSPDLAGPLTEDNLRQFRVDVAILGADALDRDGLFTDDPGIARIARAMIACAREVWLAADSSKFGRRAFVKYADWSAVARVVTDSGLPRAWRAWLGRRVGNVLVAPLGRGPDLRENRIPEGPQ